MPSPLPIVVLVSGRGTTLAAMLDAQAHGLPIEIRAVLSDRRTAPALSIAESHGVATVALRPRDFADRAAFDRALLAQAAVFAPELVVLAGYMRILDASVVAAWRGRMINLHPSLLPKYPGLDTYNRTLAAGDTTFGASVHYVTDQLDGGPVIARVELAILPGDSAETLSARLRPAEHRLLIEVLRLIAAGRIRLATGGIELDRAILPAPLQLPLRGGFPAL
jgi:phosphoribosylglycinamide formyltransferase-1